MHDEPAFAAWSGRRLKTRDPDMAGADREVDGFELTAERPDGYRPPMMHLNLRTKLQQRRAFRAALFVRVRSGETGRP
jgi:hypothetical protein